MLLVLALGATAAQAEEPPFAVSPFLQDQSVLECVEQQSPGRIPALMRLELAEHRIEGRFAGLKDWITDNPGASDEALRARLGAVYSETEVELRRHQSAQGQDETLNVYLRAEASRILAETALRLCIAGVGDSAAVDDFRAKAAAELQKGREALVGLDTRKREEEIPAVVARMARTDLAVMQLDRLREASPLSTAKQFDRMDELVGTYREISGLGAEKRELDLIQLEAVLSLDRSEVGSIGGVIALDESRTQRLDSLKESLKAGIDASKSPRYLARATHLRAVSEFYGVDRLGRDQAVARLKSELDSHDAPRRERAERAATELMGHLGGTSLGRRVLEISERSGGGLEFREAVEKFRQAEQERAREHDRGLREALGAEAVRKLELAGYDELVRSDGTLKRHQQQYVESLSRLGELQAKRTRSPKSVADTELQAAIERVDTSWVFLRCSREQLGLMPSGQRERPGRVKSPFGSFDLEMAGCRKLRGSHEFYEGDKAAAAALQDALVRKRDKELAWIAGEFAFDVAAVLATGGAAALAKAPIKAGLKKAGTALIRSQAVSSGVVKVGIRSTALVAKTLATDLSIQTVSAGRNFLEAGFRGHWDAPVFAERNARHTTRLLAIALANRGLEVLWGRARVLAPALTERINSTKLGSWLGESTKGAANAQIGGLVGEVATIPFDGCSNLSASPLFSGEKWISSMRDSILSQLKVGSPASSSRYVGASFAERLRDFNMDDLTPDQLARLRQCKLPSAGTEAVEGKQEGKQEGKSP